MSQSVSLRLLNRRYEVSVIHILLVLFAVGSFLRFYRLTYESLWLDEIFSMRGADPTTSMLQVYEYSKHDQPPLFFAVLFGWLNAFGYTDFAGRALTCLYGVAAIPVMYLLGKEIKSEKVGLLAAFFVTINWFHIDISKEIRFYPLVFLLTALSYLFFLKATKTPRTANFLWYVAFTALLLNTHYYGLVVFASQVVMFFAVIILFNRKRKFVVGGLISGIIASATILHWMPIILGDLQISSFHVNPVGFDFPFQFAWSYIREPVTFAFFLFSLFLLIKKLWTADSGLRWRVDHMVIAGWLLLSFALPLIYSLAKIPLLTVKYSTIAVPAVLLVFAYGFSLMPEKVRSYALIAISLSAIVILFIARPPYKHRRAEDWREVALYFSKKEPRDELIFSQLAWYHEYYFKKFGARLPEDQNVVDVISQLPDKEQVWLLMNSRYTGGWPVSGFSASQLEVVENEFVLKDSVMFKQTKALLYVRKL